MDGLKGWFFVMNVIVCFVFDPYVVPQFILKDFWDTMCIQYKSSLIVFLDLNLLYFILIIFTC